MVLRDKQRRVKLFYKEKNSLCVVNLLDNLLKFLYDRAALINMQDVVGND